MLMNTSATFASAVHTILNLVYSLEWLLSGVAVTIFLWGCVRFIAKAGDAKAREQGRQMIVWGLVALFVIFSIQGILWLACISLLGNGGYCGAYWTGGAPS